MSKTEITNQLHEVRFYGRVRQRVANRACLSRGEDQGIRIVADVIAPDSIYKVVDYG